MENNAYKDIEERIAPEVLARFLEAGKDYGDTYGSLGIKGQFADIWRKVGKLKRALWFGEPMLREQPREIVEDLIGHCYLTLHMMDKEENEDE